MMKLLAMTKTRDEMNSKRPINTVASLASPTSISPVVLPCFLILVVIFLSFEVSNGLCAQSSCRSRNRQTFAQA